MREWLSQVGDRNLSDYTHTGSTGFTVESDIQDISPSGDNADAV
jgi:hypothetical protein